MSYFVNAALLFFSGVVAVASSGCGSSGSSVAAADDAKVGSEDAGPLALDARTPAADSSVELDPPCGYSGLDNAFGSGGRAVFPWKLGRGGQLAVAFRREASNVGGYVIAKGLAGGGAHGWARVDSRGRFDDRFGEATQKLYEANPNNSLLRVYQVLSSAKDSATFASVSNARGMYVVKLLPDGTPSPSFGLSGFAKVAGFEGDSFPAITDMQETDSGDLIVATSYPTAVYRVLGSGKTHLVCAASGKLPVGALNHSWSHGFSRIRALPGGRYSLATVIGIGGDNVGTTYTSYVFNGNVGDATCPEPLVLAGSPGMRVETIDSEGSVLVSYDGSVFRSRVGWRAYSNDGLTSGTLMHPLSGDLNGFDDGKASSRAKLFARRVGPVLEVEELSWGADMSMLAPKRWSFAAGEYDGSLSAGISDVVVQVGRHRFAHVASAAVGQGGAGPTAAISQYCLR